MGKRNNGKQAFASALCIIRGSGELITAEPDAQTAMQKAMTQRQITGKTLKQEIGVSPYDAQAYSSGKQVHENVAEVITKYLLDKGYIERPEPSSAPDIQLIRVEADDIPRAVKEVFHGNGDLGILAGASHIKKQILHQIANEEIGIAPYLKALQPALWKAGHRPEGYGTDIEAHPVSENNAAEPAIANG